MPLSGVETDGGANMGKYRRWNAVKATEGIDMQDWIALDPQEKEQNPLPQYQYSQEIKDFSSLLVPEHPSDTTLDTFRIWTDTNYPGERYIMLYSFRQTDTGDGWPQRLYLRVSGTLEVDSFSEAAIVTNPTVTVDGGSGTGQLAMREAGGWRIQYSKSQGKFVTASIYYVPTGGANRYSETVAAFDDPFACQAFGVS